MADSNAPIEIASTVQAASINRHPDPRHDINPSTAASKKQPVRVHSEYPDADADAVDEDEIPVSVLDPVPRRQNLPPLPDLRFEQSYLKSIQGASGVWGWKGVAWITFKDQVLLPLIQGIAWSLILHGWRHWNRSTKFSGKNVGARLRRWWWEVNNWTVPTEPQGTARHSSMTKGKFRLPKLDNKRLAAQMQEYYEDEFSNAGAD